MPYLGGAAIVVSLALVVVIGNLVDPPPSGFDQLAGFLGLGVLLAVVGLIDDLGKGLTPWLRLLLEAAAGVGVWWLGISPHLAGMPKPVDALVTVVWVVGITNAFNLLDNMDGLSAGIAVIAALAVFGVSYCSTATWSRPWPWRSLAARPGFSELTFTRRRSTWETQAACSLGSSWPFCSLSSEQTPLPGAGGRDHSRYRVSPSSTPHLSRFPDLTHRISPFKGGQTIRATAS